MGSIESIWLRSTQITRAITEIINKSGSMKIIFSQRFFFRGKILEMVNSVEGLDILLQFLQNQLEEKDMELEISKVKIASIEEHLKSINDTANEFE